MTAPVRLDIGCGSNPVPGFSPIDIKGGQQASPLAAADGSVDEIRASHVLEHFPHGQVAAVVADWVRALKPGGLLRVAVPDFEDIARRYLDGEPIPVQGYVMGGQVDAHDYHGTIFDAEVLRELLENAGLIGVVPWTSEQQDCAALPISLNLQGVKPPTAWPKTAAVISVPRLGWNDMWGCAMESLGACGIRMTKTTGAFWEQCLTRGIIQAMTPDTEWILTLDYDTVFTTRDLQTLLVAAIRHPDSDAIAALQVHRQKATPLLTIGGDGANQTTVPRDVFDAELTRCRTAHFGLTLIRAEKLRSLPQPWFHAKPAENGEWNDDRTDADISFWRSWEAAGNSLYVANRVPVGHLEVLIRWPGRDMQAIHQHPHEFHVQGKPEGAWR